MTCGRGALLSLAIAWAASAAGAAEDAAGPRYRIAYATYFGGRAFDQAREVIVHPDGSVLVGGMTASPDLPTTPGVAGPRYAGDDPSLGHGGVYGGDCFLLHLSDRGDRALAATYFGGSRQERAVYGMALDPDGNVVLTSATRSPDLPTTEGAFQRAYGGPPSDWFAAKIAPDLRRVIWCTYIGGSGDDFPRGGLAVNGAGYVYVVGGTASADFPTTDGAFQRRRRGERDAAIVKLRPDGSGIALATLLGGSGWDGLMGVRVDAGGAIYVAGHTRSPDLPVSRGAAQARLGGRSDAFFAKLSPDGRRLIYATYLGGRENEFAEHRPWLQGDGSVLLTGVTASPDFPTTPGAFARTLGGRTDGFLTRLAPDGRRFAASTLLGGSDGEFFLMPTPVAGRGIALVGTSRSPDFPVTPDALQPAFAGAAGKWDGDGILAILRRDAGALAYATFLGGRGGDLIRSVAVGPKGAIYLVGSTNSEDFPATPGALQTRLAGGADAFVVKLVPVRGAHRDQPSR